MKPIEQRLGDLLRRAPYNKVWLDAVAELVGDVHAFRLSFQRMHRRAQRAERSAHSEGRRADRMARQLRLLTPAPARKC